MHSVDKIFAILSLKLVVGWKMALLSFSLSGIMNSVIYTYVPLQETNVLFCGLLKKIHALWICLSIGVILSSKSNHPRTGLIFTVDQMSGPLTGTHTIRIQCHS